MATEKRRVNVAQFTRVVVGKQVLVKKPDQIIDDPVLIATLEREGVELIELDVNGRPAFTRRQIEQQDKARKGRVEALANHIGVLPTALNEALDKGGHASLQAVSGGIAAHAKPAPPPVVAKEKPGPSTDELAGKP